MGTQESLARMRMSMDLDKRLMNAMMTVTAGRCDAAVVASIEHLGVEYRRLLESTPAGETLVTARMLEEKLADLEDWRARALESVGRAHDAIQAFERAASMFDAVGKSAQGQQSRGKAGELRLEVTADFDEEIQALRKRLEGVQSRTLDCVQTLIQLGELHSKANDDFEAVKYLERAEQELAELGGHPSDENLLADLGRTMTAIQAGETVAGASSIEAAVKRRALTQRLLLALGNAYRTTSPDRAAEYERRLRALDDGKAANLRDLLGRYLDSDGDVSKFLANLPKR